MSAAHAPRATPSPSPAATGTASGETPQALCEAWLKDPWRPGVKTWDREDFDQLSTLAGSPQLVLFYCWTQLPMSYWRTVPLPHFPSHSDNGHWAWPAGGKPAPGDGSSQGGNWGPGGGAQGGGNSQANKASGASTSASIGNASTGNRTARP